jgi:mannose-6-phosphate isomerase-like protein (cupin superfamily)
MTNRPPASRGSVIRAAEIPAERGAGGANVRTLLDTGGGGPGLVRQQVDMPPQSSFSGRAGEAGALWFVIDGTGLLEINGQPGAPLRPDLGLRVPPGSDFLVLAGEDAELRLDLVSLPAAADASAAGSGPDDGALRSRDLAGCDVETTGDRQFRVLFGPDRDCAVATQFVGQIPPGRAPEHSHPYDEVVRILHGHGTAHIGGVQHALAPGTCLHLPPGLPHCLENTGSAEMRVLGVFHPANSPAAKLVPGG